MRTVALRWPLISARDREWSSTCKLCLCLCSRCSKLLGMCFCVSVCWTIVTFTAIHYSTRAPHAHKCHCRVARQPFPRSQSVRFGHCSSHSCVLRQSAPPPLRLTVRLHFGIIRARFVKTQPLSSLALSVYMRASMSAATLCARFSRMHTRSCMYDVHTTARACIGLCANNSCTTLSRRLCAAQTDDVGKHCGGAYGARKLENTACRHFLRNVAVRENDARIRGGASCETPTSTKHDASADADVDRLRLRRMGQSETFYF